MREENYIVPASRGIFYGAFGRKKQVSHRGSLDCMSILIGGSFARNRR